MTVFFHGNFGLDRPRMAKMAKIALSDPKKSDADLGKAFNYGAPFATKYRYWLHKTGIAELGLPFRLTPMGRVVWDHDPKFDKDVTKWFMHHELTIDPERAEAWHFFNGEFQASNKVFSRDDLQMALMMKLSYHHADHFGPKSTMIPVIARKLIECYVDPQALGGLQILQKREDGNFQFSGRKTRGPWNTAARLARAYGK